MSIRIAVVGGGLVGSALTRQLAERGMQPICFGPTTGSPYSSHDDSGRITRILDGSPVWARLAARAIEGYSDLEARSGVRFHHPVGVLWSARSPEPLAALEPVKKALDVDCVAGLGGWEDIADLSGDETMLERGNAGYIAPCEMARAQRVLGHRGGAVYDDRVVVGVESSGGRWLVWLNDGTSTVVDRVAVAAGAGTRQLVDVDLEVTGEIVIHAEVSHDSGARLADLPCIGRLSSGSIVEGYLTPPIREGAGWHIKFGAESEAVVPLSTAQDVSDWMAGDAHLGRLPALTTSLTRLLPGVEFGEVRSKACIYVRTASGLPIVDELEPGLIVVTGGNGRMAKSADAVAGLAASLVIDGAWVDDEFDPGLFCARPAATPW